MSLTDYLEPIVLDAIFGAGANAVSPGTFYLGASLADPTEDASGVSEPVGNGYARVPITNNATNFPAASIPGGVGTKTNGVAFDFPTPTGTWGLITHWVLFDSLSGGNALVYGSFAVPKNIASGDILRVPLAGMSITVD